MASTAGRRAALPYRHQNARTPSRSRRWLSVREPRARQLSLFVAIELLSAQREALRPRAEVMRRKDLADGEDAPTTLGPWGGFQPLEDQRLREQVHRACSPPRRLPSESMAVTAVGLIRPPLPVVTGRVGQGESKQGFNARERGAPTITSSAQRCRNSGAHLPRPTANSALFLVSATRSANC